VKIYSPRGLARGAERCSLQTCLSYDAVTIGGSFFHGVDAICLMLDAVKPAPYPDEVSEEH
jgi:hypothetical protein